MNILNRLRNFKLYRWWKGGLWILLTNQTHWLRARWSIGGFIYDERCHAYHRTSTGIIAIEDYTE